MKSTASLISELRSLTQDLKEYQSNLMECEQSARSTEIARKVEIAREKLNDLRQTQQREKEFVARRREIDRENARH